jgi:flagellar biosynthesis protein FlhF
MRLETFRGPDLATVSAGARRAFGDDVMIVRTRTLRTASGPLVEVTAGAAEDIEKFSRRLTPARMPLGGTHVRNPDDRPYMVALVGPTGAGKTTTAAKLAVHPSAFGTVRVGLLTLDTYRAGALEQLGMYAEVAGIPLEIAYDAADMQAALGRLQGCDAIIVDTPGRSPRADRRRSDADVQGTHWRTLLDAIQPDEVHLALPATIRADIARGVHDAFDADGEVAATHMLLTKLDEVPEEAGVADLAAALGLPARWVADGQEIPADLAMGPARILRSLGTTVGSGKRQTGSDTASTERDTRGSTTSRLPLPASR